MLVLSRKLEQEIHLSVAEDFVWKPGMVIKVVLLSFSGAVTRVGVDAPQDVIVRRGELADRPPVPRAMLVVEDPQRPAPPEPSSTQEPRTDG